MLHYALPASSVVLTSDVQPTICNKRARMTQCQPSRRSF